MTHMATYRDGIACHRELAKVKAELAQARETEREYYRNAITSFVASVRAEGELARERDAALATIARVEALASTWTDDFMTRDQTGDDRDDRADARDDCAMDIRAALTEPTP